MWPFTFWGRHKSRVFQYRILGRIFGLEKREVGRGGCKKLFHMELHNTYP